MHQPLTRMAGATLLALGTLGGFVGVGAQGVEGSPAAQLPETLFATAAERCFACHTNLVDDSGNDVSIGYSWRASMMANSARDPYWQASIRAETLDHPEHRAAIEDKCSTCHMPMSRFLAAAHGGQGEVFTELTAAGLAVHAGAESGISGAGAGQRLPTLASDGVSCTLCHQVRADGFGEHDSYSGGFAIDVEQPAGERQVFGPYEVDSGRTSLMRSAARFVPVQGEHIQESELCATCHTLFTNYVTVEGEAGGELPEQVPYLEWLHSEFRDTQSCQDCHMPEVEGEVPVSSVLGIPRSPFSRHAFRGGNSYVLGLLRAHRSELGVVATDAELEAAIDETAAQLGEASARLGLDRARRSGGRLDVEVAVENLTGHKLPTAYPSRRAWLHFTVRDAAGVVLFESGAPGPDGQISGNDNDADAARFERHYETIDGAEQVQIYEPVMVDSAGGVTTGLLFGARYIKDNRLLPRGFDKATAHADVAVHGAAYGDPDFSAGGDRVRYSVQVEQASGPLVVEVELLYQTIAYRWAQNLRRHQSAEATRFLGYYDATAGASPVRLARIETTVED